MYFTTRDPKATYDTLGKGYTRGACDDDLAHHAMLMEYQNDDITFARVSFEKFQPNLKCDLSFFKFLIYSS